MELAYFLALSALLFGVGLVGALTVRNAIRILMCIELMLNAVNLNLIAFGRFTTPERPVGQVFTLFIIAVAAAEAAVGLAIILMISRKYEDIDVEHFRLLKG